MTISLAHASPLARGFKRANSTAPAVNVKETDKSYVMELAAPGIKKEYCRVAINDEGNLTIAIEKGGVHDVDNIEGGHQQEHKHEDKHHHYLRREFSYSNYEQSYTLPDDVVRERSDLCQGGGRHLDRHYAEGRAEAEGHQGHRGLVM